MNLVVAVVVSSGMGLPSHEIELFLSAFGRSGARWRQSAVGALSPQVSEEFAALVVAGSCQQIPLAALRKQAYTASVWIVESEISTKVVKRSTWCAFCLAATAEGSGHGKN